MTIITLAPKGSFHVGEPIGIERQQVWSHIPSDTLFAAFVTVWAQTGELDKCLPRLCSSPLPLLLTSAFPCLYTGEEDGPQAMLRFFPRPMVKINASDQAKDAVGKELKRAAWVSERLFARLLRGENVDDALNDRCFGAGAVWVDPRDLEESSTQRRRGAGEDGISRLRLNAEGRLKPLWKQWDAPRVTLDRLTGASTLYHVGQVTMAERVGLWFALRGEADLIDAVMRALAVLSDSGLGGLRSTGHGAFVWGQTKGDLPAANDSGYAVTLSRYAPHDADEVVTILQRPQTAYSMVNVGGWCTDDVQHAWRRRAARLIAEGSVIACPGGVLGQLLDVTPKESTDWQDEATPWPFNDTRRVYRWGYAFPIGVATAALPEEVENA